MLGMKFTAAAVLAMATYMCEPEKSTQSHCQTGSNNSPDGGLTCGVPYDISGPGGAPGHFAGKVIQYVHINAAGLVETDAISQLLFIADYDVANLKVRVQLCRLEIPQVQVPGQPEPTRFQFLPGFFDNLDTVEVDMVKEGETTCSKLGFLPAITLFGVRLTDAMNDALPTDAAGQACPDGGANPVQPACIYDMDADGHPGVTLLAQNLPGIDVKEAYMVIRSWTGTDAIVANDDMILGQANWGLEQLVIGCSLIPMGQTTLRVCNDDERDVARNVNPVLTQVENRPGDYLGVRIPDDYDCKKVIELENTIFGR